jgi:hypothetical protein
MGFWTRLFTLQGEQFPNLLFNEMISSFPSVQPRMPHQTTTSTPFSERQSNFLRLSQPVWFLLNILRHGHPLGYAAQCASKETNKPAHATLWKALFSWILAECGGAHTRGPNPSVWTVLGVNLSGEPQTGVKTHLPLFACTAAPQRTSVHCWFCCCPVMELKQSAKHLLKALPWGAGNQAGAQCGGSPPQRNTKKGNGQQKCTKELFRRQWRIHPLLKLFCSIQSHHHHHDT